MNNNKILFYKISMYLQILMLLIYTVFFVTTIRKYYAKLFKMIRCILITFQIMQILRLILNIIILQEKEED